MLEYYRFKVINEMFTKGQFEEARLQLKELQERYVNLCEENSQMKAQLREHEDILFLARNFIFDGTYYWLITGHIKQGPFCPHCYNRDGQLVRLTESRVKFCPECGCSFSVGPESKRNQESGARLVDQAAAVGSLRSFSDLEISIMNELAPESSAKINRGKAKIIPFNR